MKKDVLVSYIKCSLVIKVIKYINLKIGNN